MAEVRAMKVLFDANILLDIYLQREPWVHESQAAFQLVLDKKVEGYISAISPPTLYYVMRRTVGSTRALELVDLALSVFSVASVDYPVLVAAL